MTRVLAAALAAAAAASALAWRHHAWVRALPQYPEIAVLHREADACPKGRLCGPLSPADANRLGWLSESRSPAAYFRRPERKPAGTFRIGVFGCSFVAGDEAAAGEDFPNLLQGMLRRSGGRRVEVLNFGAGAYGMHQSYLLWSLLAARYGLDEAVFMPMSFHRERDDTFIFNPDSYGPIHSRYTLRGGSLELVEAAGGSPAERSRLYYRWLPLWRYLRYDVRAPALLRALLPAGRSWKANPFYYWRSPEDEVNATYAALFAKVAAATRLVVVSDTPALTELLERRLGPARGVFMSSRLAELTSRERELYYAPGGHMSAAGNWARAQELAALLDGKTEAAFAAPALSAPPAGRALRGAPALRDADAVLVRAGALPAGVLLYYGDYLGDRVQPALDLKRDGVAALVVSDLADRPMVGMREKLEEDEPVELHFQLDGQAVTVPVGRLRSSSGVVGRVEVSTPSFSGVTKAGATWRLTIDQRGWAGRGALFASGRIAGLWLGLGARRLLNGTMREFHEIAWSPAEVPHFIYLRADEASWRGTERYRAERSIDLVLRSAGRSWRVPLFALRWRPVRLPVGDAPASSPPLLGAGN